MQQSARKLQVLLITRNLPPLIGGMERLLHNLVLGLVEYAEVTVIGPRGCRAHLPARVETYECSNTLGGFLMESTLTTLRIIRKGRFDVVIGGSGLTAPLLLMLKSIIRCRTLILVHGLDIIVDHWLYQHLFIPALRRIDRVVANSRNTRRLAMEKGVPEARITIIHPGTYIAELPNEERKQAFVQNYRIPFTRYMLFAGRMTRRKGLSHFIRCSLPDILKACPDSGLVVVGDNPNDSLNKQGEQQEVLAAIHDTELAKKVLFLGQVDDRDLETAYASATVHVFPLIEVPGDVEGFGMVAIEAAAMGTPTVAFDVGGVSDAVGIGSGHLVAPGNYIELSSTLIECLKQAHHSGCAKHAKNFTWIDYHRKLRILVEQQPNDSAG